VISPVISSGEVSTVRLSADRHRQAGVDLRLGAGLGAVHGKDRAQSVETTAGDRIDCDLVIIGIGITPRTDLAEQAGLAVRDGITVDARCQTSAAAVFAAGDCANYPHPWAGRRIRLESVQNAIEHGKAAAAGLCDLDQPFDAIPWFWSDQYDLKLQIAGLAEGYDATVLRGQPDSGSFSMFYLSNGRVIAVDCVNDPRIFIAMKKHLALRPEWPAAAIADPGTDLDSLVGAN
jgi:3-phenylpropionate/trans-cinnamate dioxygenase ferredoxin reductase subunit